jgi:predicted esterase
MLAGPGRPTAAPLLLVLHGATGDATRELERWRPATQLGFIVAAGQSSQPATADGFCWDPPRERVWADLREIVDMLPPHARVVIAGFSQGAWVALNLGLSGDLVQAGSVVMVAPFAGSAENLERAWRRMKVSILTGQEDVYRRGVEGLAEELRRRGHHVGLEVIPGLGHAYPADFESRLPGLLRP